MFKICCDDVNVYVTYLVETLFYFDFNNTLDNNTMNGREGGREEREE